MRSIILINSVKQSVCTLVQLNSKFKMETSTFKSVRPILTTVLPLLWLGRVGVGLSYGLMGPIQPYLARYILAPIVYFIEGISLSRHKQRFCI